MSDEETAATSKVSPEEMRTAFSGSAVLSNKFYVSITESGVRIAFCEDHPFVGSAQFRTAVLLPFGDAIALSELISSLIAENVRMKSSTGKTAEEGVSRQPQGDDNG